MSKKYDKWLRNKEWLEKKYLEERLCPREIAEIVGCTCKTVHNALKCLGIQMRSLSEANKGHLPWMTDKHHSEETKRKIGDAHKGDKNHMFGKHHSEETKQKMRAANKDKIRSEETKQKMREAAKNRFKKEEERQKLREARKRQKGFPAHHTKPELIWQGIVIDKHSLPFKYTGDGAFWIGGKPAINPDFIHLTKKIAIEIFSYWHDPLRRHCKVRYSQTYEGRKKILKKYGWKMIVFWQDDLEQEDAEKHILRVLKEEKVI